MKFFSFVFPFALFFVLMASPLYGVEIKKDSIETISFVKDAAGGESIRFKLAGRVIPDIFIIGGEKPRLVLDFFATRVARGVATVSETPGDIVKRIRLGIHNLPKPKTRVVVDLASKGEHAYTHKFLEQENVLLVTLFQTVEEGAPISALEEVKKKAPETGTTEKSMAEGDEGDASGAIEGKKKPVLPETEGGARADTPAENETENTTTGGSDEDLSANDLPSDAKLLAVTFENTSNKGEMVLFKLNGFYPPIVFGVEKGDPRVVCDFLDTRLADEVARQIPCNGRYIKTVRVTKPTDSRKVRVVLNLVANRNYDLQQVFFKEDNLFVLIVNALEEGLAEGKGGKN